MAKAKTTGVPVGKALGFVYGAAIQPYYGGGYNNASDGGKVGGFRGFGRNLGENWTGYDFVNKTWKWEPLVNGPGAVLLGHLADHAARIFRIQKIFNRGLKILGIKARWTV